MTYDIFDELKKVRTDKAAKLEQLRLISERNNLNEFMEGYSTDPAGFIEKVGTWKNNTGLLYPHQKELLQAFHEDRFHVVHCARRVGLTQTLISSALHYAYFNNNKTVVVMGYKKADVVDLLRRINEEYHNFPEIYKKLNPVVATTRYFIEFANGTKIISERASEDVMLGMDIDFLLIDNFGLLGTRAQDSVLMVLIPMMTVSPTCKVVIGSTGSGSCSVDPIVRNVFFGLWEDALGGRNPLIPHSVSWRSVPNWDEEFKNRTIYQIGEKAWEAEYEVVTIKDNQKWHAQKMRD